MNDKKNDALPHFDGIGRRFLLLALPHFLPQDRQSIRARFLNSEGVRVVIVAILIFEHVVSEGWDIAMSPLITNLRSDYRHWIYRKHELQVGLIN